MTDHEEEEGEEKRRRTVDDLDRLSRPARGPPRRLTRPPATSLTIAELAAARRPGGHRTRPRATGYSGTRSPRGIAAPGRADRRKRHTTAVSHSNALRLPSPCFHSHLPLLPFSLLSFSSSARGPGRGGRRWDGMVQIPPSDFVFLFFLRSGSPSEAPGRPWAPSDQTRSGVFVLLFSL